ncbi:hypothetical protein CDAR_281361 [Caerostris darwini]|uniref:Uncharacterized protein n=1 Tax=Caerostris darwini TaxID=1538125 RepID=A0AAV4WYZ8_9ARAC|nr:hypothetical protein CDAR_281361 [Caerostris darwini]
MTLPILSACPLNRVNTSFLALLKMSTSLWCPKGPRGPIGPCHMTINFERKQGKCAFASGGIDQLWKRWHPVQELVWIGFPGNKLETKLHCHSLLNIKQKRIYFD